MEAKQNNAPKIISQGIEELIDRLKQKGVTAGKDQADELVRVAENKANKIVSEAQAKAKAFMDEAHEAMLKEQKAAEDALQLAARNMRVELRQNLMDRFTLEVKRLVHKELNNEEVLRELIMFIGANTAEQLHAFKAKNIELQLPVKIVDFDEIRSNPALLNEDPLKPLVQSLTRSMLQAGMTVTINPKRINSAGIKVHLVDEDIMLDLSEEAVSELLVKHMQPRFRALLEGLLQ